MSAPEPPERAASFQISDRVLVPTYRISPQGKPIYCNGTVVDVVHREEGADPPILHDEVTLLLREIQGRESTFVDDKIDDILPLTHENLLTTCNFGPADQFTQAPPETAIRWLRIAAEHRSAGYFLAISGHFPDLPYEALGNEFLNLVLTPSKVPFAVPFWDFAQEEEEQRQPANWARDVEVLVDRISVICGVHRSSFPINETAGLLADGGTLEHVAAARGDTKLLAWLIEYHFLGVRQMGEERRMKCDSRGRTPIHLAVLHGHTSIVRMYAEAEAAAHNLPYYFCSVLDFESKDDLGTTAMTLASELFTEDKRQGMVSALAKLQQQIYQKILDCFLAPTRFEVHAQGTEIDFDYLERIVAKFKLDLGRYSDERALGRVYSAVEEGKLDTLRWLVDTMGVPAIETSDPSDDRYNLLHVAARRAKGLRDDLGRRAQRDMAEVSDNSEWEKCFFLDQWNGIENIETFASWFCSHYKMLYADYLSHDKWVNVIQDACGNSEKTTAHVAMISWLIGKGVALPDCTFLVNDCDYASAAFLLQYRLDVDSIVSDWFVDRAPQANMLVKDLLHGTDPGSNITPDSVALGCIQRSESDPQNEGEMTKLKLLEMIIQRYDVDPTTIISDGKTILHLAIENDHCLIALWLSANFRPLVYTRALNGKLPVHTALEKEASQHICEIMMRFTSEVCSGSLYDEDRRIFLLADRDGRTVQDYAMDCSHSKIKALAFKPLFRQYQDELVEMIAEDSTSVADIVNFVQKRKLKKHLDDLRHDEDWFPLLHAAIGFGRLRFLCWLDQTFFKVDSLPHQLTVTGNLHCGILPVICHPGVMHQVNDLLEVSCSFRINTEKIALKSGKLISPAILDGQWQIMNWMPIDDSPTAMVIQDLRGTCDAPGMEECLFSIYDDGTLQVQFNNGTPLESWVSLTVLRDASITRLDFRRLLNGYYNGEESDVYHPADRILVLTKISNLAPDVVLSKWRLGKVEESSANAIKVRYSPYDQSNNDMKKLYYHEWIERDSARINRSGILKLRYSFGVAGDPFSNGKEHNVISGKYFAEKCMQADIIEWIAAADAIADIKTTLEAREKEFLGAFFSKASNRNLERLIHSAQQMLEESSLPADVVDSLEDSLYVLDRNWSEQPILRCSFEEKYNEVRYEDRRLFILAASFGRTDRFGWVVETQRVALDSIHLRKALMKAVEKDQLDTVRKLISLGVDPTGEFGQFIERTFEGDQSESTLIEIALKRQSGKVAYFLLEGKNLVPEAHLSDSLVTECVTSWFAFGPNAAEKAREKALYRAKILRLLCNRGFLPTNSTAQSGRSTMEQFLHTLEISTLGHPPTIMDVPLTLDVLELLCDFGGDIVSAFEDRIASDPPFWLNEYVENVKADEKVMRDLLNINEEERNQIISEIERDVTTLRDRRGRSLVELAAIAGNTVLVIWLVKEMGAGGGFTNRRSGLSLRDLCHQLGYEEIVTFLDSLAGTMPKTEKAKTTKALRSELGN